MDGYRQSKLLSQVNNSNLANLKNKNLHNLIAFNIERKQLAAFTALTLPLILAACGGGGGGSPAPAATPTPAPAPSTSHSGITVSASASAVDEGGEVTYTLTAGTVGDIDTSVDWSIADGSSDFSAASGTVTLSANSSSATFTVTATNDTTAEAAEAFTVTVGSAFTETLTVNRSDNPASDVTATSSATSVAEGGSVTYTLTAGTAGEIDTAYDWAVADGTADFDTASGTATIAAGETSTTFTVTATDDTSYEAAEAFTVTAGSLLTETLTIIESDKLAGTEANAGHLTATSSADTYIYDVTFDTSGAVTQGDDGNVIITGFDASSDSIVLRGGYGSSQSTAAYADGGTSNVDIASNISGDTVITLGSDNDKTSTITLKGVSDTVSLKSINQPADSGSPTVDLSSGTVTAAAAGEIFEYSVDFLNGVPVATDGDVTISGFDAAVDKLVIKTESLPAGYSKSSLISGNTAGVDVTQSITDTRIDFGANSAGESGSITLSGITDSDLSTIDLTFEISNPTIEGTRVDIASTAVTAGSSSETFVYDAAWDGDEVVGSDGDVTITGFDLATDKIVVLGADIPSGYDRSQFEANTIGSQQVVVDSINNKTVIYFAPNSDGESTTLTLAGVADEDGKLNIVFGSTIAGASTSHSSITVASTATSVAEGGDVTYTLTAGTVGNINTSLDWSIADGSSDFSSSSGTVTLSANESTATFTVTATNDTTAEAAEAFTVTIGANTETLTVNRSDNPASDVTATSSATSVAEGGSVTYTLTAGTAGEIDTAYDWAVADGTADFDTASGTATIAAGETSTTFTVTATDDTSAEAAEAFTVTAGSVLTETLTISESDQPAAATSYTVVNVPAQTADSTITATSAAEDFRYEVSTAGVSEEGAYTVTIDGFDIASDKLTLVLVNATSNMTTTEFEQLTDVEVTSDGISGTQVLFALDSNAESGKLILPGVEETFISGSWTATTYTVEIIADTNLTG